MSIEDIGIRGVPDDAQNIISAIHRIVISKYPVNIKVNIVVTANNIKQLDKIFVDIIEVGVKEININLVDAVLDIDNQSLMLSKKAIKVFIF